jgi:hypothetical protein
VEATQRAGAAVVVVVVAVAVAVDAVGGVVELAVLAAAGVELEDELPHAARPRTAMAARTEVRSSGMW